MAEASGKAEAVRGLDLDDWELYRVMDSDTGEVLCSIGLRASGEPSAVEYGFWALDDAEPTRTGTLSELARGKAWSDKEREEALREVVRKHGKDVALKVKDVVFNIGTK
ncbi:MAG: hypothetical protein HUU21_13520 [Polyangiaceae bacterium]|nr:hypothetical protein [Polyangiaceae bacterium]